MRKVALILLAVVFSAAATSRAQNQPSNDERGGTWVKGHWSSRNHHRLWVRGHWTTSEQAREEYKDVVMPAESQPLVGKFVDEHWTREDGRLVYVLKHFAPVASRDTNFSAAALNAKQVELVEE